MGTWPQLFVQKSTHSSFLHPLRCGAGIVYAVLQDHRPVTRGCADRIGLVWGEAAASQPGRASQQEASGLGALQTALSSDRVLGTSPPRWRCSSLPLMWNACRKSKRLVVEEKQFFIYALCLQRASPEQTAATFYVMKRQIWMCIVPGTVLQQSTNCRH